MGTRISREEAGKVAGAYATSNGWHMKIYASPRFIDATIDNEKPIRLRAIPSSKFISGDGDVTVIFGRDNWGAELTMTYVPRPNLVKLELGSASLAQR